MFYEVLTTDQYVSHITIASLVAIYLFVVLNCYAGAYEPPKAVKERATTMYTLVPSKYKFEQATVSILGKCASIRDLRDAINARAWHA